MCRETKISHLATQWQVLVQLIALGSTDKSKHKTSGHTPPESSMPIQQLEHGQKAIAQEP
jgi:hypothetical protein